jgi:hypothetical protein
MRDLRKKGCQQLHSNLAESLAHIGRVKARAHLILIGGIGCILDAWPAFSLMEVDCSSKANLLLYRPR